MNFQQHFEQIQESQDVVENHVWSVFEEYIKIRGIHFNSPENWQVDCGMIIFHGSDGCRGCYDRMQIEVPLKYFTNLEELKKLKEEVVARKQAVKDAAVTEQEKQERQELTRLQEKYK